MASQFVGLNRGQQGFTYSDFTVGSSTGSTDIELRFDTGKSLTREDVYNALKAFQRWVDSTFTTAVPPL